MLGVEQVIWKALRVVGTLTENIKARLLAATDTARRFLCNLMYSRLVVPIVQENPQVAAAQLLNFFSLLVRDRCESRLPFQFCSAQARSLSDLL